MLRSFGTCIMALTPEVLLSAGAKERCITNLKELPIFINKELKFPHNAAVLVPLCINNGEVCLLYTLRSSNLNSHSGQVSFPGGKMDKNETVFETALRETEEEIGVPPEDVDIWTDMHQVHGRNKEVLITPIVGQIKNFDFKKLKPNMNEVDEIFTVPMSVLCDKKNHAYFEFNKIQIPVFMCGKHKVWGITGMITHLFLQCFLNSEIYDVDFMRQRFELGDLMPSKI